MWFIRHAREDKTCREEKDSTVLISLFLEIQYKVKP